MKYILNSLKVKDRVCLWCQSELVEDDKHIKHAFDKLRLTYATY